MSVLWPEVGCSMVFLPVPRAPPASPLPQHVRGQSLPWGGRWGIRHFALAHQLGREALTSALRALETVCQLLQGFPSLLSFPHVLLV